MSEKRLVSSVFITLSPPWRGPPALPEETRKDHAEPSLYKTKDVPKPAGTGILESSALQPSSGYRRGKQSERARGVVESWLEESTFPNGDASSLPQPYHDDTSAVQDLLSLEVPPPPPPPPSRPNVPPLSLIEPLSSNFQKMDLTPSPGFQVISPLLEEYTLIKPPPVSFTQANQQPMTKQSVNGYREEDGNTDICAFCRKGISAQAAAIEAMRKQYHASCFTCRKCQSALAGQRYYQMDGQPMCDACYKHTLDKCAKCHAVILDHIVRAMGSGYHPECFTCVVCQRRIADESFAVDDFNEIHCAEDYYRKYAPVCSVCLTPIIPKDGKDSYKIECLGKNFHEDCYRCEKCRIPLSVEPTDLGCFPLESHILCKTCHLSWDRESSC
ncbi:filamin-binding LIM protein 1 isoform X2 [Ambystoma mexicanum]|uniref:filamin-binding LIM protein 1 isoform X2 n=1 Tax=Ambystoma mexicanum TaxID=8296 RepID=UPI0037E9C759